MVIIHFANMIKLNSHHFIGYTAATASEVQVSPKSLYPCRTSQSCTRYLHCVASQRAIKWHYPNSTVITSTHTTTKTIQGNDYQCSNIYVDAVLILTISHCQLLMYMYYLHVHSILVDGNVLRLTLNPPEESDAGLYTCSLANDSTKNASVLFKVIGKLHLYVYLII